MAKPTVLVDMDGVVADWTGMFEGLITRDYPHIALLPREQITEFYMENLYPPEHKADLIAMMHTPGFYRNLDPIPGAIDGVLELASRYEVFFCSTPLATHETCASEKLAWIGEHYGREWVSRTVLTADKTLMHGNVLIDDKNIITGAMRPSWKHFVFDDTHNQVSNAHIRIKGWHEAVPAVDDYLRSLNGNAWKPSVGFTAR